MEAYQRDMALGGTLPGLAVHVVLYVLPERLAALHVEQLAGASEPL